MPTIKFKFRSSLNFDSVDIGDRASISVGELKSEIQRHMKLSISSDSCLLLSDAVSGQGHLSLSPSGSRLSIGGGVKRSRGKNGSKIWDMRNLERGGEFTGLGMKRGNTKKSAARVYARISLKNLERAS